jgi:preprotein translocase subunit SecG
MYTFIIVVVLVVSALMVLVILSQQSKGGASGQFSGNNSNQMIGAPQKTDILERITWGMISSIFVLVIFTNFFLDTGKSTIENNNIKEAQKKKTAPAKQSEKPAEKKADEKK